MLIDDNPDDNFFHERVIRKSQSAERIITKGSAAEALEFLKINRDKDNRPDLIFLDINMPGMNGWEFLEEYNRLDKELQGRMVVIMLTTSVNPDDIEKAKKFDVVSGYKIKPLTQEMLEEVLNTYLKQ
jgi:response regulator of citrate/malate metabolism